MDTVLDMLLALCIGCIAVLCSRLGPSSTDVGEATRLAVGLGTAGLPAGMHRGACWKLGPTAEGQAANGEADAKLWAGG